MTNNQSIICSTEEDTACFARSCARHASLGDVFTLNGPLGAGKSVFARAFIQELCGDETDVPSPTFTLVQTYEAEKTNIWHFDLYRLETSEDIYEIGWEEALRDNITIVEWPERLGSLLPQSRKDIIFKVLHNESRKISANFLLKDLDNESKQA